MTKDIETLSAAGKSKRKNLRKMAIGTAYAVPIVVAFNVGDMITNEANAYNGANCNNGHGNGDQCAPGNSFSNNAAENDTKGQGGTTGNENPN